MGGSHYTSSCPGGPDLHDPIAFHRGRLLISSDVTRARENDTESRADTLYRWGVHDLINLSLACSFCVTRIQPSLLHGLSRRHALEQFFVTQKAKILFGRLTKSEPACAKPVIGTWLPPTTWLTRLCLSAATALLC